MGTDSYCCSPVATGAGSLNREVFASSGSGCDGNCNGDFGDAGVAGLALEGAGWSLKEPVEGEKDD